jgi:transglutaminase-like putative cysteine protease
MKNVAATLLNHLNRVSRRCRAGLSVGWTLAALIVSQPLSATEPAAHDTYQPGLSILHRIVHVTINEDGTAHVVTDLARRADHARGVRVLGEDKIRFRETMTRLDVIEAWSVTPEGKRIDVPVETVRIKDDYDEGDGDSDNKVATLIYPGLEVGSTVYRRSRSAHHTTPYPGHVSMRFFAAPRLKVDRFEVNIVHPAKVPLQVLPDRFEGGRVALQPDDAPDTVRYRFVTSVAEALPREDGELDIDDWAPSVLMSTFPDYATLAAAYQSRAAPRAQPDEEIRELALKVTQGANSDRERVAHIREWVNRNIRYLSVHIGVDGWIPHPATHVLKTRYGDCKDQTAFMQAMLRAVGIDSTPALINTGSSYYLPRLPQAGAFDHVIVYIPSLDLYVDPTDRHAALGSLPETLYGKPALLAATGTVVRLPVVSADRDFVETTARMQVDEQGRVRGSSKTRLVGAAEGDSRRSQHGAQSRSMEDRINDILLRYDEGGTGRIWAGDPLKQGEPWEVNAEFELDSVVSLPGPSAMRIPVAITRADIRAFANWRPLANRRNPFGCSAGRWRDDIEIELPMAGEIAHIPSGVSAERGSFRYRSEWTLEGNRLRVVRELSIERGRGYCVPQDERDFIPVREAMRRDLMGQVIFGPMR